MIVHTAVLAKQAPPPRIRYVDSAPHCAARLGATKIVRALADASHHSSSTQPQVHPVQHSLAAALDKRVV